MQQNPFFHALAAAAHIVLIVFLMDTVTSIRMPRETVLLPMTMLSLFVLSAAVMGYLFVYQPVRLYMENKKDEALTFFGKTVGYFACFAVLFILSLLYVVF